MWFSLVFGCPNSGRSRARVGPRRRCRPQVEALGERLLPSFTPAGPVAAGLEPFSVAVADFNGDGKQDFAVANFKSGTVSIRLGNDAGGFTGTPEVAVGSQPYSVAVGDFNSDGRRDLAVANYGGETVSIRLGDGTGAFAVEPDVAVGINPASVAVGDFNGDGKPDLAVATEYNVAVLLNTFPNPPPPALPPPRQIVAVAFRRKGVARVRVRDAATGALRGVLTPFRGFAGRLALQLRDVNGDGALDLIVQAVIHGKRKKKVFDAVTLTPLLPVLV